jgi:hypothetical protein
VIVRALVYILVFLLGASALAQEKPPSDKPPSQADAVKALAGSYEMSNADRDRTCVLTLKADSGPGGFKLDFDRNACVAAFPPLKDVAVWTLYNDAIRFTDAKGKIAFEFTEVEDGMYESLRAGQPLTFLQNAAIAKEAVRTNEEMSGDWNVVRNAGTPICRLTLTTNPTGSGDLAVQVKPGCDAVVTRFAPALWQMDRGELLLKSARGQVWRFEDANGAWQRVPTDRDPVMLTRP